jgi:hypothetical protein
MKKLALVLLLVGCGNVPVGAPSPPLPNFHPFTNADGEPVTTDEGQGGLPLGYYERQCQWDACDGPPPTVPGIELLDPVPMMVWRDEAGNLVVQYFYAIRVD